MSDNVDAPAHYIFPDGTETITVSRWLTSNGGQAVQYIARSTRSDGVFKNDRVEDLRKAIVFIQDEIDRLSSGSKPTLPEDWAFTQPVSKPTDPRKLRTWNNIRDIPAGTTIKDSDGDAVVIVSSGLHGSYRWPEDGCDSEGLDFDTGLVTNCGPFTEVSM